MRILIAGFADAAVSDCVTESKFRCIASTFLPREAYDRHENHVHQKVQRLHTCRARGIPLDQDGFEIYMKKRETFIYY